MSWGSSRWREILDGPRTPAVRLRGMGAKPIHAPVRDRRPLPIQVRDGIRDLIEQLDLGAGDKLPTEREISASFDVGRTTVREALKLLEQDGIVQARQGLGRFLSAIPRIQRPITRLESVTEMMRSLGYEVTNRVVSVDEGHATDEEAAALRLPPGALVLRLERVRLHRGEPLIYSLDVMPRGAISGAPRDIDWSGSLLLELERHGKTIASATAEIRAVTMPTDLAARLELPRSAAWLLMVHVNLGEGGEPVIYSHDYYRGDIITFNVLRRRFG
jgi:GntR family transcriptional regulator